MNTGPMSGGMCTVILDELEEFIRGKLPSIVGYNPTPAEIAFCLHQLAWTYHFVCHTAIEQGHMQEKGKP